MVPSEMTANSERGIQEQNRKIDNPRTGFCS